MPARFFTSHITLGTYNLLFLERTLTLSLPQVLTHWHIIGKSGSGKSFFLAHLYVSLLKAGIPVTLLDPHGTLAPLVFYLLVADGYFDTDESFDRLLYLDLPGAERQGRFLPFNIFQQSFHRLGVSASPNTIANKFRDAMHRAFPELREGAATFDSLLPRAVRVLMHHKLSLIFLEPFLLRDDFRKSLLDTFPDPIVVMFFKNAFAQLRKGEQLSYAGSVLRRAQLLTDSPILKYSLGSGENYFNIRDVMDGGRSAIINLAVEDKDAMKLLTCLLTVGYEQAALSRSDVGHDTSLVPHMLLIDEFASFVAQSGDALSAMLSQTRKYKLWLMMAHQNWSQTSEKLKGAMGNCEVEVAFRLSRDDAEYSARVMGSVDPDAVKHEVADEAALDRTHPSFYSLPEQWEQWVKGFQEQKPRHAMVGFPDYSRLRSLLRLPTNRVVPIKTPHIAATPPDAGKREEVEREYLRRYFTQPGGEDARPIPALPDKMQTIRRG